MMPGGVDEQKPGHGELPVAEQLGADLVDVLQWHLGRPDVLRDPSGLMGHDRRSPDVVQQAGLAVVHVAQHADDGLTDGHVHRI